MKITQRQKILRHLKDYGTLSPLEALSEYGIMRLSARISELKSMGYNIKSTNIKDKNRYGETVHYARYYIEREEEKNEQKQ